MAHEFFHLIEDSMCLILSRKEIEAFRRWDMLNPADFIYSNQYKDDDGRTLSYKSSPYVASFAEEDADVNEIYFIDGYSTTYAAEDRARLFENLYAGGTELVID